MLSIEICNRNAPKQVEPGVWNSPLPNDSSGLHVQGSNSGNTSLPSTSNDLDTSRGLEASGASVIPTEASVAPLDSQLQQLHASKRTHAYHQRSVSSSSNEEELAKLPYIAVGVNEIRGRGATEARVNDMGFNEADAALLISPIISRTQSTTFHDPLRGGSVTGVQRSSIVDMEDIEGDTSDVQHNPTVDVNHTRSMPSDFTRKEQKMGVLSSAAHRLSTVSGLYLTPKSGPGRHSPPG
ncbi:hypothetical protein BGX38DRAFT_921872 [Terfezia claveryi]|nr:hypothetical protein BGX38DRAFT_1147788 [Terfezia claveryi]KAF8437881.1 hypothetical protein BGX38DRAFT_921872 [Terfezia claveryi]